MASNPIRLSRLPVIKLSTPRTVSPRAKSSAAIERPINPAAPVTRYLANVSLRKFRTAEKSAALVRILPPVIRLRPSQAPSWPSNTARELPEPPFQAADGSS